MLAGMCNNQNLPILMAQCQYHYYETQVGIPNEAEGKHLLFPSSFIPRCTPWENIGTRIPGDV